MTRGAIQLLKLLRSYGRAFPFQATLAAKLGCTERTVRRYVQELSESGLLIVQKRGHSSAEYQLIKQLVTANNVRSEKYGKVREFPVENLWNNVQNVRSDVRSEPPHLLLSVFELEVHEVVGQQAAAVFVPSLKIPRKPPDGEHAQTQAVGASP